MATHLIAFAWAWFVAGLASGVVLGLGFWRNDYLGGSGTSPSSAPGCCAWRWA